DFAQYHCNREMVEIDNVIEPEDIAELKDLIQRHLRYTGSMVARRILDDWEAHLARFVKVTPHEYKRVLQEQARSGGHYEVEPLVGALAGVENG
ncbi:MAG TPA: hypothetical protein VLM89_06710, partial [Phycisphaerae bacterium]|nr:hypothetical protein [Phycisphaerae bacterium]